MCLYGMHRQTNRGRNENQNNDVKYCKTLDAGVSFISRAKQNVKLKGANIDYIATVIDNLDVNKLWLTRH